MGWKTVKGNRYFYEYVRENGKSRLICWGYGREAREAAARVERKKRRRAEQNAEVARMAKEDAIIAAWFARAKRAVRERLTQTLGKHGYRWVCGHWRKMNEPIVEIEEELPFEGHLWTPESRKPKTDNVDGLTENELRLIKIVDVQTMENTIRVLALDGLRRTGPDFPLEDYDKRAIVEEMYSKLIQLKERLKYQNATEIEQLVIEQIMTAWVQWYVAGWQVETMPMEEDHLKTNHYLERKFLRCQTRLARSLDQLARLRCVPRNYLEDGKPPKKGESEVLSVPPTQVTRATDINL